MSRKRILIMGAAGRDFHNFNLVYRNKPDYQVVAFTATQIPNIDGRKYPAALAGKLYPNGIPIYPEKELSGLIKKFGIDEVVFSYSDISHEYVMHKASEVVAAGAGFSLLGGKATMLESKVPVVAVCAVRTGAGKSQTTRRVTEVLKQLKKKVVAVRHPMPYGDLSKQVCQRFATLKDLDRYRCTIEEREEYEPHIARGTVVYAGVDYEKILRQAEKEADVIVWDGGNNDLPFYRPDLFITVLDPLRPGHELLYFPGEANLRAADVVVINKVDTASFEEAEAVRRNVKQVNPKAKMIEAASPIFVDDSDIISGKRVLVVEDGPTLTHGGMTYGAGIVAAEKFGAREIIDPRPYVTGTLKETFAAYPHIGKLLPAMGYGKIQVRDLERTINKVPAEVVVIATPVDLRRIVKIRKPAVRVRYELQEIGKPDLKDVITAMLARTKKGRKG